MMVLYIVPYIVPVSYIVIAGPSLHHVYVFQLYLAY